MILRWPFGPRPGGSMTWSRRSAPTLVLSKSGMSRICADVDAEVAAFRDHPLTKITVETIYATRRDATQSLDEARRQSTRRGDCGYGPADTTSDTCLRDATPNSRRG